MEEKVVVVVVVVFISTAQHQLVSTEIHVYNTNIMESSIRSLKIKKMVNIL